MRRDVLRMISVAYVGLSFQAVKLVDVKPLSLWWDFSQTDNLIC